MEQVLACLFLTGIAAWTAATNRRRIDKGARPKV